MTDENYLLKWNDFDKNLSEGLRSLKTENTFCDVTLACEEAQLEAHRVVLSVCSDFFRNVLTRSEHHHPYLFLKGVRMADMETILQVPQGRLGREGQTRDLFPHSDQHFDLLLSNRCIWLFKD